MHTQIPCICPFSYHDTHRHECRHARTCSHTCTNTHTHTHTHMHTCMHTRARLARKHTHARLHARMHACKHTYTHTHTHTHTRTHTHTHGEQYWAYRPVNAVVSIVLYYCHLSQIFFSSFCTTLCWFSRADLHFILALHPVKGITALVNREI